MSNVTRTEAFRLACETTVVNVGDKIVKNGLDAYYARKVIAVLPGDGVEALLPGGGVAFYSFGTFRVLEGK